MKRCLNFISKYKYLIGLIIVYILFFLQMQNVCFYGDDYEVLYPVHNEHNFSNVLSFCLQKMNYFWNEWSGRIVGHFTVSFVLSFFGIQFFRILNPIMVFFLIFLCLKIFSLFKKFDFTKLLFFISVLIFGLNIYITRETIYWAYSSILYIWGFNLTLLVIYFVYKNYLLNKKMSIVLFIFLFIISFVQTFILEQISFILISFLFLILIASIKNKKETKKILFLLLISIVGFISSALAPGNVLRTDPLVQEISYYTVNQIIVGKAFQFYNVIFNPKLYGLYFMFLVIIIEKNYRNYLNGNCKFLKKIPYYILCSYFFLLVFDKLFYNIDIFTFYTSMDVMNIQTENLVPIMLRIIYFTIYIINLIYMVFKTIDKDKRFLLFSFIVTFVSAIIPVIFIRYFGTRYYFYFFLTIIFLCINYILKSKKDIFDLRSIILLSFVLPFDYAFEIVFALILFVIIFKVKMNIDEEKIKKIIIFISCVYIITNIVSTMVGYNYNKKIYDYNNDTLINSKKNEFVIIKEIPYQYSLYSWHTINLDFNNYNVYYGFYLNDFYKNYYGVDMNLVIIKDDNGGYTN